MEQHAVPQDITGFKFKLVGDMTLVQFGELAGGMVLAYVAYSVPTYAIIKFPVAFFFAMLGIGLAFVPIEERPMHVWIFNFFKAIYRPTYYIWKKNNVDFLQTPPAVASSQAKNFVTDAQSAPAITGVPQPVSTSRITDTTEAAPLSQAPIIPTAPVVEPKKDEAASSSLQSTQNSASAVPSIEEFMKKRDQSKQEVPVQKEEKSTTPAALTGQQIPPPMTIEELVKRRAEMNTTRDQKEAISLSEAERKVNALTEQNKDLLRQIDEIKNKLYSPTPIGENISELTKDLNVLIEKKSVLAGEIATVRDQLNGARVAPLANPAYQEPVVTVRRAAKVVPAPMQKQTVVSLTSIPNVVNGLVLDEDGKPLDGAILIIKDGANNSIRALRTNKVGQFIASTPLSNGNYFIEAEKVNHSFDVWQITLSGEILEPLEIKAKVISELTTN